MEIVDIGHIAQPANREHIFVLVSIYAAFINTDYRLGYKEDIINSKLQEELVQKLTIIRNILKIITKFQ